MISSTSNNSLSPLSETQPTAATGSQGNSSNSSPQPASGSDTVKLSATAQALAMYQQGVSVNLIAANLGVSTAVVDSYLDLTTSSSSGGGAPSGGAGHSAASSKAAPESDSSHAKATPSN